MKNLPFIFVNLLAALLLNFGCKEEGQLLSGNIPEEVKNERIEGKWVIDSLSLPAVNLPSFCKQVSEGTTFEFTESDSLKVYLKGATEACDIYHYQVQDDYIQLVKGNMIMLVTYRFIADNGLKLQSKSFFRWQEYQVNDSSVYQLLLKEGVAAYLTKLDE